MPVVSLDLATDTSQYGTKATNLSALIKHDLPVPPGLAVGIDSFTSGGKLKPTLIQTIISQLNPQKKYAVRSSALEEDGEAASWAGQFDTFLQVDPSDIISKIETCHNSAQKRAQAYSQQMSESTTVADFQIAVVVQEMLDPDYAGVLFTKDPTSGANKYVTEYIAGLGESLVGGQATPHQIDLKSPAAAKLPFSARELQDLAEKTVAIFNSPQDIEWAAVGNQIWLLQSRPITAISQLQTNYDLGEPEELFYWGPSRAFPIYMSDFMAGIEKFFIDLTRDDTLPNPPKTAVLFHDGLMVWLNNAADFTQFTQDMFLAYEKLQRIDRDYQQWQTLSQQVLHQKFASAEELAQVLISAWYATEFAEFALYGAETTIIKRFQHLDEKTRQTVWGAFTVPEKPAFLSRIDSELADCQDPAQMAAQYPWVADGYFGVSGEAGALDYFQKRLEIVGDEKLVLPDLDSKRKQLIAELKLSTAEVKSLTLVRKLIEFMDERKAWMMQTRHLIAHNLSQIEHGWFYRFPQATLIPQAETEELWQRYIQFKSSRNVVTGLVASNGGHHFVNGEAVVISSPTENVPPDKILIVPATSPSYIPLMRQAKALITDHGGVMSHAAIIAREFSLPCIVGTKIATKSLKTGDQVLLDMLKGEVKKA